MQIQVDTQDMIAALTAQRNTMADAAAVNAAAMEKLVRENTELKARLAELEAKKDGE